MALGFEQARARYKVRIAPKCDERRTHCNQYALCLNYTKLRSYVSSAPIVTGQSQSVLLGVPKKSIEAKAERGFSVSLGQLYGIVHSGLIFAKHAFQGFKRPMYAGDDREADGAKISFTWSAKEDARLVGNAQQHSLEFSPAPNDRVFAVYISPNEMLTEFPDIMGWIEHWTWLPKSNSLQDAPIDWETRYDKKLWSR